MIAPDLTSDLVIVSGVSALLLLSSFSLVFIFYFNVKTLISRHLKGFNSFWSVRILLVIFACLWSLSQLLALPILRRHNFPLLSSLTLTQQKNLCKIYTVSSLGFFEPCFFVTLLFLVNVSLRKRNHGNTLASALCIVLFSCFSLLFLNVFFVFFFPPLPFAFTQGWNGLQPEAFARSYVVASSDGHGDMVFCTYPLVNTVLFGGFGFAYVPCFLLSCWRVVSLVINKKLRVRIYVLASTVVLSLPTQLLSLSVSVLWKPKDSGFHLCSLVGFLSILTCAVMGLGILVVRPIADSLAVGSSKLVLGVPDRSGYVAADV